MKIKRYLCSVQKKQSTHLSINILINLHMANFAQMSTKKLAALLEDENTTPEQKNEIQEVLNKRSAVGAEAPMAPATPTDGQQAAASKGGRPAGPKMSDEERAALIEQLKAETVNHRCEVVPFGTIDWIAGTIVGIMDEKRSGKIMYAVQADDGRRIVKVYGSPLIKILDEVVERTPKARGGRKVQLDENGNPITPEPKEPWTDEQIEEEIKAVLENVGRKVTCKKGGAFGKAEENAEEVSGRIVSLVIVRRSRDIQYRILIDGTTNEFVHKVVGASDVVIDMSELDDEGKKANERYVTRRYSEKKERVAQSKAEKIALLEEQIAKTEEKIKALEEQLEARKAKLEAAKGEEETPSSEETPNNDDMM